MPAPRNNNYAKGNDGGAPPANQNAATHHLYSDPDKLLTHLEREEPEAYQWVHDKYEGYLEDAPFGPDSAAADQLLQVAVREYSIWTATGIQLREGILTKTHIKGSGGELHEVEREHPVNKPLNRMERQVTQRLKQLGVIDDPASQPTDALADASTEQYEVVAADSEAADKTSESDGEVDSGGSGDT